MLAEPLPDTPESKVYQQKLAGLPLLQDQGDGIKAFVGIMLAIMTTQYPLVTIDEPEAFLHPPQAYLLGQMLAEQHARGTQVLIATHSADIIAGIVSVQAKDVSIVRLTRRDDRNNLASIQPEELKRLYDDPLIKYYPIMDGLFARGAVVCEADSDCTYYRAALEAMGTMPDGTPVASLAMHFTHCSGKARMPRAVEALKSAEVPVVSVVDIDILQNDNEFEALVAAHKGDTSPLAGRRNTIIDAVNSRSVKVKRIPARAEIEAIFDKSTAEHISTGDANKIREAIVSKSGWREFKKLGADMLQGGALVAFNEVDQELRKLGIFMVRQGELEQFHPEVSSDNKAEWLRKVLEAKLYRESEEARQLLSDIAQHITREQ